jgi:3-dehydrosphinganine reductase
MGYYQNRLAFVFGASEGIGASVTSDLLKRGAEVVAFSRSEKKLSALKAANASAKLHVVTLDVTDFSAVERTVGRAIETHGTPFFVMNFAGSARPGFIDQLDGQEVRKMMDLNFFGTFNVIKALSKTFLQKREGHIVTCSSMAGFIGLFGYTGYCASKFAVIGFSEALRREWAPFGIKVSVLCPPNTKTPGLEEENKYKPAEVLATEEKAKTLEPAEVAKSLLDSLPSGTFQIVPTFDGKMANYLNRVSPRIIDMFVKRPGPQA